MVRQDPTPNNHEIETVQRMITVPAGYEVVVEHGSHGEAPRTTNLLNVLWRRRWLFLLICSLALAVAGWVAHKTSPIYTATALLRLGTSAPKVQPFQETPERGNPNQQNPVATHIKILKSRAIAEQVVAELNYQAPEPSESAWSRLRAKFFSSQSTTAGPQTQAERQQRNIDAFLDGLKATSIAETQIFEVSYASPDPEFSARAVNSLCAAYLKYDYQSRSGGYGEAQRWLDDQLARAKENLTRSEAALYQFVGEHEIDYMLLTGDGKELLEENKLHRDRLAAADALYQQQQLNLQQIEAGGTQSSASGSDPNGGMMLAQLRQQLAAAQVEFDRVRQSLGPQDATYKATEAARARIAQQLADETARQRAAAKLALGQAREQREQLAAAQSARQQQLADLQKQLANYNILKRDVELNRELYGNLLQKWKEVSVGQSVQPTDVSLLQRASVPRVPDQKLRIRILVLGLLAGLALSMLLSLLLEQMNHAVRDAEDARRLTGLEILGSIPSAALGARQPHPALIARDQPASAFAQQLRGLRLALAHAWQGRMPRRLLITSAGRGEGKTTLAANLATLLAQKGKRVLLVDGDPRRRELESLFGPGRPDGIHPLNSTPPVPHGEPGDLLRSTGQTNLWLLSIAERDQDAVPFEGAEELESVLSRAEQNVDQIIIDADSLEAGSSAIEWAACVDAILLVVRPGAATSRDLTSAQRRLELVGGRLIGLIVNELPMKHGSRSHRPVPRPIPLLTPGTEPEMPHAAGSPKSRESASLTITPGRV